MGALGSAILIASAQLRNSPGGGGYGGNQNPGGESGPVVPPPQAIADSGLQSPQEIAAGFGSLDPDSRASIAGLLDAIDSAPSSAGNATTAPSSRTFTSLTDGERQAFITQALAPLAPPPATSDEVAGLQAFYQAVDAVSKQIVAQIPSGTQNPTAPPTGTQNPTAPPTGTQTVPQPTQGGAPPGQTGVPVPQTVPSRQTGTQTVPQPAQAGTETVPVPQTAPPSQQPAPQASTSTVLAETLLAGLQLVAIPPPPPPPELPPLPPPAPPQVIDNLFALLNAGVAPEDLPQSLIDQLTAGLESDVEPVPPPLPVPVFGDALAVWIHGA